MCLENLSYFFSWDTSPYNPQTGALNSREPTSNVQFSRDNQFMLSEPNNKLFFNLRSEPHCDVVFCSLIGKYNFCSPWTELRKWKFLNNLPFNHFFALMLCRIGVIRAFGVVLCVLINNFQADIVTCLRIIGSDLKEMTNRLYFYYKVNSVSKWMPRPQAINAPNVYEAWAICF